MGPSIKETEIKLRFESAAEAVRRVEALAGAPVRPREFEDNVVFDDAQRTLRDAARLLRLRRTGERYVLTYKERLAPDTRHKVRLELETGLDDFDKARAILERLGYRSVYRYQKFRTTYRVSEVEICIDETPLGCFVELEGPPDAIDRLAERLGFGPERFITSTYRELHARSQGRPEPEGDLLMAGAGESPTG